MVLQGAENFTRGQAFQKIALPWREKVGPCCLVTDWVWSLIGHD